MAVAVILCLVAWTGLQDPPHTLRLGDDCVEVLPHGALGHRVLPKPTLPPKTAVPSKSAVPAEDPRVWRVRVGIATRLHVGEQRIAMSRGTPEKVRAAFAEFAKTVFAWSRGRVRIDAEIGILPQPLEVPAGDGRFALVPTAEGNCGIPGRGVESVFLVYPPGHMELAMLGGTHGGDRGPDGAGSTGIAWVPRREAEMARTILHEWLHQIEWLARRRYGMPWLPGSHDREDLGFVDEDRMLHALLADYLSAEFWRRASMRGRQDVRRLPPGLHPWQTVADDPWRRLPRIDATGLAKLTGESTADLRVANGVVEVRSAVAPPVPQRDELRLDRRLVLSRESALILPSARDGEFVVLVRGDLAGLYGRYLRRDGPGEAGVVGVMLPMRPRRRIGAWAAGGTATPLMVFVTRLRGIPGTEAELLALRSASGFLALHRDGAPVVVGSRVELARIGKLTGARLTIADRAFTGDAPAVVAETEGALPILLAHEGIGRLLIRIPVLPRVSMRIEPRSGPAAIVRPETQLRCWLRNNASEPLRVTLETILPPGVRLVGLPESVGLDAKEQRVIPCRAVVDAGRSAGTVDVRLVVRSAGVRDAVHGESHGESQGEGHSEVHGEGRCRLRVAVGRDFLRLGFETRELTARPAGYEDGESGDWRAVLRQGDAARGGAYLRLVDGGGSRFGRHYLLAPSPLSFDTKQFPYLTMWIRGTSRVGARAAINVRVGERTAAVPLVGDFVRHWDRRVELERARVELDGEWHRVVYDLDAALEAVFGSGNHRVSAIDIGDTRQLCSNRYAGDDVWHLDVDEFAVVRDAKELP